MGLLTGATLGGFSGGTGSYAASYDILGRLTSGGYSYTPAGVSASTLYQIQPTYDVMSNVIEDVTTLPQGVDTQVFCSDDLSRLTWAGSSGTPACSGAPIPSDTGSLAGSSAAYSASYAYDTMNRLTASPLGGYSYGDSAHADAATAIGGTAWSASYDAAGNMLCRAPSSATTCAGTQTGAQLGYDNQGQLASWQNTPSSPTSTDRFLYDGEGNRVEQVATTGATTTTTTYVGSLEELATTGSSTTTTAYYGGMALSVNGALSYTLSDGLGSVSESVGADGMTIVTQLYGPYGAVRYQSGSLPGTRAYTGQRADAATGLDYYGARYYDPLAGQFSSADTVSAGGLNRYAYVGGNPESASDPSGHARISSGRTMSLSVANAEAEAQPHIYFGHVSDMIASTGQLLGSDTLSQSYHTLFLDPHATAGDKARAAGAGGLTLLNDAVLIGSFFADEPEVGEGAEAADEALFATLADTEKADEAVATTTEAAAEATSDAATTTGDLTRVGRWMSPEEYGAMTDTGIVQEGGGGTTYVAHPADPAAYQSQASSGSRYVEFDVPQSSLRPGGKEGWAQIPGPNSLYGRLAQMRGEPVPQFPPALNIGWLFTK